MARTEPFILRCPPFPGAKTVSIATQSSDAPPSSPEYAQHCLTLLREQRVGGTFWGAHARHGNQPLDPWHRFAQVDRWQCRADDETALLARIYGIEVEVYGNGRFVDCANAAGIDPASLVAKHLLDGIAYQDPFNGEPCGADAIIAQLGQWRELIERNRSLSGAIGIARWKRPTVTPLLWNGYQPVRYARSAKHLPGAGGVAVWKSRTSPRALEALRQSLRPIAEIEDGFIRSSGLGADCVPPLSIILDMEGIYFDPSGPSGLETLLREASFTPELIARAEKLRGLILSHGISKYEAGTHALPRPGGDQKHILVTGQVEDDRSILSGGGPVRSNFELLRRARATEPNAYIIYKPHPDVEAGHRIGHIPDDLALGHADAIVRDQPISALLDMVDGVHVITSLAGFEGLLRGKQVTTHGAPFYAGWGLTTDLAPIPNRRGVQRTISELIAATLILYPRYVDPVTGLPCPPEILIQRMANGINKVYSPLVRLRRIQGRFNRWIYSKRRITGDTQ